MLYQLKQGMLCLVFALGRWVVEYHEYTLFNLRVQEAVP